MAAIKIQIAMLILPSKYWISNNCVKQNEKIDVHHALSKWISSFIWYFLLKTIWADIINSVIIEEINNIVTGYP